MALHRASSVLLSTLVVLSASGLCPSSPRARPPPRAHLQRARLPQSSGLSRARCSLSMLVEAVESTPNPSAFLLRLDGALEGVTSSGLRGQTYLAGGSCPPALVAALATEGVESLFACGDMVTVSKAASKLERVVLAAPPLSSHEPGPPH